MLSQSQCEITRCQQHLKRLESLRLTLLILSVGWPTAPVMGHLVGYYRRSLPPTPENAAWILAYPVAFIILASLMLTGSSRSRQEAVKILTVPFSVLGVLIAIFLFSDSQHSSLLRTLVNVGIFVCPIWALEILRQRAYEFEFTKISLFFLAFNHLAALWLLAVVTYPWLNSHPAVVALSMTLYMSCLPIFLNFRRQLLDTMKELQGNIRDLSE